MVFSLVDAQVRRHSSTKSYMRADGRWEVTVGRVLFTALAREKSLLPPLLLRRHNDLFKKKVKFGSVGVLSPRRLGALLRC